MKFWKVRHKETGLFSTGGMNPRFTKTGKTWQHIVEYSTTDTQERVIPTP